MISLTKQQGFDVQIQSRLNEWKSGFLWFVGEQSKNGSMNSNAHGEANTIQEAERMAERAILELLKGKPKQELISLEELLWAEGLRPTMARKQA